MSFLRPNIDTWEDIHSFLVFDGRVDYRPGGAFAKHRYDFIWSSGHLVEPRRGRNPDILLSGYVPSNRDPRGRNMVFDARDHTLAWYQSHHPEWVVYKCPGGVEPRDPATAVPAYFFDQAGDHLVPLDITNPEVVAWQISHFGAHAGQVAPHVYDALGTDNVFLSNYVGFCGVFVGGRFVRRYDPRDLDDPRWCADVATWAGRLAAGLHALAPPVRLVANVAPLRGPDTACRRAVLAQLDGVLDEGGFMRNDGPGPLPERDWLERVALIEDTQHRGHAYYAINEYITLTPSARDFCAPIVSRSQLEWALGSYLMAKERSAAVFISGLQQYGCPLWYPELGAHVGHPCGLLRRGEGVWVRDYSRGVVVVNASDVDATHSLPTTMSFVDLDGKPVGKSVRLGPHSGAILLVDTRAPARCP